MTMTHWLLFGGILLLLVALWSAQRSKHPFDIRDAAMDPATGKASLNALILVLFAAVTCWVIVDRENDGKDDVGSILTMALGIFVAGRVFAQGINALTSKSPEAGATVEQTTTRVETTTIPSPPVPEAPPMPPPIIAKPKAKGAK